MAMASSNSLTSHHEFTSSFPSNSEAIRYFLEEKLVTQIGSVRPLSNAVTNFPQIETVGSWNFEVSDTYAVVVMTLRKAALTPVAHAERRATVEQ